MKSLSLLVIWMALAVTCVYAQTEVKESHKSVDVSVEQNDEGMRTVVITIDEDGDVKKMKWEDDGTIPDDIRKQLEEEDIDITMLEGGDEDDREVVVRVRTADGGESMMHSDVRRRVVIKKDNDGEVEVLEWDGEGDMPADIQKLMDEHDIDIEELTEKARKEKHGGRHERMKARHKMMKKRAMRRGEQMNEDREVEYEIITEDGDGKKKKMLWIADGDDLHMEGDHDIIMLDGPKNKRANGNVFFFEGTKSSNAYMGAQIESTDEGVHVLDLMKDSPADKAGLDKGDVIKMINGARTRSMEGLLDLLNFFEPGDTVKVSVLRDGKEKDFQLTLGERPDAYR